MDHGLWTAVLDGHGARALDEFAAQVRLHGPAAQSLTDDPNSWSKNMLRIDGIKS